MHKCKPIITINTVYKCNLVNYGKTTLCIFAKQMLYVIIYNILINRCIIV